MPEIYDLVVIGAGPAGQAAAELTVPAGRTAIVVEQHKPGGAVTTTGGAPTKTLREAARHLTGFGQDEVYGVTTGRSLDQIMPIIAARTRHVRDRLQAIVAQKLAAQGIEYVRGRARLDLAPGSVAVTGPDGTRLDLVGRAVLIATGSRPARPRCVPFDDPDVYDSDRIYAIASVPRDMVVVGGGPVGVEFATVLTALGIPVTIVNRSERLLPTIDGEIAGLMAAELTRRGVTVLHGTDVEQVARIDGRLTARLSTGASLTPGSVLFAAGRTPNTENLGLVEAGVDLDARGRIVVDRYFRTAAPGVYAAGDVIASALASMAMQQGRAAA